MGRKDRAINAVRDASGRDPIGLPQPVAPVVADAEHACGRRHAAILARRDLRVGELVEVVDGTDEARDQPRLDKVGERVGADPVMGVIDVEPAVIGDREPLPIFGDALLDEVGRRPALDPAGGNRDGPASRRAKEPLPVGVRRVDDRLVAERREGFGKRQAMAHAAAGVRRIGEQRDAEAGHRADVPFSRSRKKGAEWDGEG